MTFINKPSLLSGLEVKEAMRKQILKLPVGSSIQKGINSLIKYKVDSILLMKPDQVPEGIVSRTDIVSAFYAGLPLDMGLENILSGPPLTCFPDDDLETGVSLMKENSVHQLYVQGESPENILGFLTYYDIVGLLYRYCSSCQKNTRNRQGMQPLLVKEVMTRGVASCHAEQSLDRIIEILSENNFGAILIHSDHSRAAGVISKTDLILSYRHNLSLATKARDIMNSPVKACEKSELLTEVLQKILLLDIQRIFVYQTEPDSIQGILTLSDAARFRSGSCRACIAGRIVAG